MTQTQTSPAFDVRRAIIAAREYLVGILGVKPQDVLLEEVGSDDELWTITFSFPQRYNLDPVRARANLFGMETARFAGREVKSVRLRKADGEFVRIDSREPI